MARKKDKISIDVSEFIGNRKKKIFEYKTTKENMTAGFDIINFKMGIDPTGLNLVAKKKR